VPLEMTEGNYSNVGHRGPVYKGLGAMNPCDLSTLEDPESDNFGGGEYFMRILVSVCS
jgi:hypothetical protein